MSLRIGVMLRHLGSPGGIGVYTTNVLDALFGIDGENEYCLLYSRPEQLGTFGRFPNVLEYILPDRPKLWWDQVSVPRFAKRHGLDLIYNPKLSVPIFSRCPTVLIVHGADQLVVPRAYPWWDRWYCAIASPIYCRAATAIIATTHRGARDACSYMGARPSKITVVNLAHEQRFRVLERDACLPVKEKYGLPDRFVVFVGGFEPRKNLRGVLLAYDRIRHTIPHRLVLAGFPRWKYSGTFDLIDRLGLRDHVVMPGWILPEDLPAVYSLADLLLFPSLYEGFGIPTLEAMACGCPVVTTATGCSPEVVGDAALLVDPHDVEAIAQAARRVLTDEGLRRQLISRGLARVQRFSWERCARETLAVFEALAPRPRAAVTPLARPTAVGGGMRTPSHEA